MTYPSHSIRVNTRPIPKGRPRLRRDGRAYTPKTTVDYENEVAAAWTEQTSGARLGGAVEVFVEFHKDHSKITVTENPSSLVGLPRGDIDNLVKSTLDGLQRAEAFVDDVQVVQVMAVKRHG